MVTSEKELALLENKNAGYELESLKLQDANPKMVLWKKVKTEGFGVGKEYKIWRS